MDTDTTLTALAATLAITVVNQALALGAAATST
jgi:hypothetical protein